MAILVRNVSSAQRADALHVPTRTDGSFYRYELICDGGWSRVYDDSTEGLMDHLCPGYLRMSADGRLAARIRHAVDAQVRVQAQLNSFFHASPRTKSEEEVLNSSRDVQPSLSQWDCAVPLVVVDAFYAPYTDVPAPISGIADVAMPPNLWMLHPAAGELEYLRSLHEASFLDLHVAKGPVL